MKPSATRRESGGCCRGGASVRLACTLLGAYGVTAALLLESFTTLVLVGAVLALLGVALCFSRWEVAGSLMIFLGYTVLDVVDQSIPVLLGLAGSVVLFIYSDNPSVTWRPTAYTILKALPFAAYGTLYAYILHNYAPKASYLPALSKQVFQGDGGYALAGVASTVFFSLLALWVFLPGRSIPSVGSLYRWLSRNRIAPVEALVYALVLLSPRANLLAFFAIILGVGAYVWVRALGYGRAASFLGFVIVYALLLYLTGAAGDVDAYFARIP